MKKFYALLIVALFATAPALMAQSASFYNATRDAEKMIRQMPTEWYYRVYVGYNTAHSNWKDYGPIGEMMFPVENGITLGYLESRNVVKGLPIFVEYGANIQYLRGKAKINGDLLLPLLDDFHYKANTFAINVPVNAALRLSFENDTIAVTPFAGLNIRYNLAGKQVSEIGDTQAEYKVFNSSEYPDAYNRLQFGLNFGVAVTYDVYTLSIGRVADFTRLSKEGKGRLGVTSVSLGYQF